MGKKVTIYSGTLSEKQKNVADLLQKKQFILYGFIDIFLLIFLFQAISMAFIPTAQFTANTTRGPVPLTVEFTGTSVSSGLSSYQWDMNNDGIIDCSTAYPNYSPVFTYRTAGNYTIKLTVTNASGSDSEVKTHYITVLPPTITETFGAEPNPTGDPIGGGAGYLRIISANNTSIKYTVTKYSELKSALAGTPGIIYIPETAEINMSGHFGTRVPEGFTIAGNRGERGSLGGRIFQVRLSTDPSDLSMDPEMFYVSNNTRITGVRIEGPDTGNGSILSGSQRVGIWASNRKGIEIDNCDISGWSLAGIAIYQPGSHPDLTALGLGSSEIGRNIAYIHHNYIHHCQASGLGYGVMVGGADVLIKANLFDYTRHAISGGGYPGEGYEAAYNIHRGNTTHNIFDVHAYPGTTPLTPGAIAGDTYKIHHNTFYSSQPTENHVESFNVIIRAVPVHGVWIDHNRMQWNGEFRWTLRPPVAQSGGTGRVYMTQNLIGPDQVLYPEGPVDLQ
jgi:PKD repeat protein